MAFVPRWLRREIAIGIAGRRLASAGTNLVVLLPSTQSCIDLVARFARRHPCMASGGPVLSPRFSSPELREKLRSPYEIVHASSTSAGLPMPVFSFPDQVVGDGGTYVLLEHEGKPRRWSSMEALLVLRHAPEVLYVSGPGAWPAFRFVPILHRGAAEAFEPVHLTALVGTLVSRLEMDLREPPDDWLARECYLLKEPAVFERRIRHELCDIEALLRIEMDEPGPENAAVGRILADVLLARKESMSGRLHQ